MHNAHPCMGWYVSTHMLLYMQIHRNNKYLTDNETEASRADDLVTIAGWVAIGTIARSLLFRMWISPSVQTGLTIVYSIYVWFIQMGLRAGYTWGNLMLIQPLARSLVHKEIPPSRTAECPNRLIKAFKGERKKEMSLWRLSARKVGIGYCTMSQRLE